MASAKLYPPSTREPPGAHGPLDSAMGLLRPRTQVDLALHASGSWSVPFSPFPHVKLGVVARGECWLTMQGREPILLREGDFYLLGDPPPYVLSDQPARQPLAGTHSGKSPGDGINGVVRLGEPGERDTYVCGGHFTFDGRNAHVLLDVLPQFVHVPATDPRGGLLAHLSELLVAEVDTGELGSSLVLDRLAQVLLVHMLRAFTDNTARPVGWLAALRDDGVGAALRAMHADIAHPWTVRELADISHMSRSAFASTFRRTVGTTPMGHLTGWRMNLARDALQRETHSISQLAFAIGYESESAFSTAFRREAGASPRQFREEARRSHDAT